MPMKRSSSKNEPAFQQSNTGGRKRRTVDGGQGETIRFNRNAFKAC